jgi:endoglucanase
MLTRQRLQLLRDILQQPAAPFREQHVVRCVVSHLERAGVPHFLDPVGNLVIGVGNEKAYRRLLQQKQQEPVRLFVAHMDHPGFHGLRWLSPRRLAVQWHGGSPLKHLAGARMWLANDDGLLGYGRLAKPTLLKAGWAMDRAEVRLDADAVAEAVAGTEAKQLFGGFAFRSQSWISGKRLYTRAADDLVGVFAIVATAIDLQRRKQPAPFIGLLTRAEEVGFVGAVKHLELDWLAAARRPLVCVSLEASRTLPGARIGKGPVVRLGDRRTTFDSSLLKVLTDVAEKILPGRHQRRVMDGGSCEATATTAWGLPTMGITLPLGNYHNQGFEGGMDCPKPEGPAPEFVHLDDIEGELRLCRGLMRRGLAWSDPWQVTRRRLSKNSRHYNRLLKS